MFIWIYLCFFVMIPYFKFELSDELGLKDFLCGIVILGSSIVVLPVLLAIYYMMKILPTKSKAQCPSFVPTFANC